VLRVILKITKALFLFILFISPFFLRMIDFIIKVSDFALKNVYTCPKDCFVLISSHAFIWQLYFAL